MCNQSSSSSSTGISIATCGFLIDSFICFCIFAITDGSGMIFMLLGLSHFPPSCECPWLNPRLLAVSLKLLVFSRVAMTVGVFITILLTRWRFGSVITIAANEARRKKTICHIFVLECVYYLTVFGKKNF